MDTHGCFHTCISQINRDARRVPHPARTKTLHWLFGLSCTSTNVFPRCKGRLEAAGGRRADFGTPILFAPPTSLTFESFRHFFPEDE